MEPTEFSLQTQNDADEILNNTKLQAILDHYGNVRLGGSYLTGLMYGPDIDITVATETPRESAVRFVKDIIATRSFYRVEYGDFEKFPREKRPKDHIVVLVLPFHNRTWEIEIWFTKTHYPDQIDLESKLLTLPAACKKEIIELKAQRDRDGIDKHTLSSFDIYQSFIK